MHIINQGVIIGAIKQILNIEDSETESNVELFDVSLFQIGTDTLIATTKGYIYKNKLKLIIYDYNFLLCGLADIDNKVSIVSSSSISATWKMIISNKNKYSVLIERCRLSSNLTISFNDGLKIEPVDVELLLDAEGTGCRIVVLDGV